MAATKEDNAIFMLNHPHSTPITKCPVASASVARCRLSDAAMSPIHKRDHVASSVRRPCSLSGSTLPKEVRDRDPQMGVELTPQSFAERSDV